MRDMAAGFALTRAVLSLFHFFPPGGQRRISSSSAVAITFDDGPHIDATAIALDALRENRLRATFFMTGENASRHAGLARRCSEEGHETGSHGYSHRRMLFRSAVAAADDLDRSRRALESATGRTPVLFRPPYGMWNPLHNRLLEARGMKLVLWNRSPADYLSGTDAGDIASYFRHHLHGGDIVLLHDNEKTKHVIGSVIADLAAIMKERGLRCGGPFEQG
jgi:peptidoglycan-N-acetylglucosamine deacetylase